MDTEEGGASPRNGGGDTQDYDGGIPRNGGGAIPRNSTQGYGRVAIPRSGGGGSQDYGGGSTEGYVGGKAPRNGDGTTSRGHGAIMQATGSCGRGRNR